MTLEELGYKSTLEEYRKEHQLDHFEVGRVTVEHKDRYTVRTTEGEYEAEITGNLRFTARDRSDFPAVGDWVAISEYEENKVLIHHIFPRSTIIQRQAVGKFGEKQIIGTNIDYAFIVQAVNRDFSINRIERYLTICHDGGVEPIILLNKIDLISEEELNDLLVSIQNRMPDVPVIAMSNETGQGLESLTQTISAGKTYCLLGSSGVGKSTLINKISGSESMKTDAIGLATQRGKHVTSHRELVVLEKGGILIDNPGMREVGIGDATEGLELTFEDITKLAQNCKYSNCTHVHETGCAIIEAVENGEISEQLYSNYLRMEREKSHFESTLAERRKKDKEFGKMVKHIKKNQNRNKY